MAYLLLVLTLMSATPPDVALTLSASYGFEPLAVRARMTVARHPDSRTLCLVWNAPDGGAGQSCQSHEGEGAPITVYKEVMMGAGHYEVRAVVFRAGGQRVVSEARIVEVVSGR